jgi:hypothetical protein
LKVPYVNNDGGGFADHIAIKAGTRAAARCTARVPGRKSADFLIGVKRQPLRSGQILQYGDRIRITQAKIEGAAAA